jgi:hypothetical protein
MSEQEKYVICKSISDKINPLVAQGYRVHTIDFTAGHALMSLKSEGKYEDIIDLRDVLPEDVYDYLEKGWRVTESYSKRVRMVKPSEV